MIHRTVVEYINSPRNVPLFLKCSNNEGGMITDAINVSYHIISYI